MKLIDIIESEKRTISFEVFPPKKETAFEKVKQSTDAIAALEPEYMSVTYGAGGGTSRFTLDIASSIHDKYHVPSIAHLTCVSNTKEEIKAQLDRMKELGIKNILALRGDIPEGAAKRKDWSFQYASELVEFIRQNGDFCVGGACYPEGHPESSNMTEDIKNLKHKVENGVEFLTTQMFFDNDILFHFLYTIRDAGIEVPVVPGIMPMTKGSQLKRIKELSGSYMPVRFLDLVDRFGDNEAAMRQAGIAYATDQIIDLYAKGIKHVHVYAMNDVEVAQAVRNNISAILG